MTKNIYTNEMPFTKDNERKGAKYNINGKWANHGEYIESVAKWHRGLDYTVNPTTSYKDGSDIESEHLSVKSDKASLARCYGQTKTEILDKFFQDDASEKFAWIVEIDEEITEYIMNRKEFRKFCEVWGKLGKESSAKNKDHESEYKVRFSTSSAKMIKWLEDWVGVR